MYLRYWVVTIKYSKTEEKFKIREDSLGEAGVMNYLLVLYL